MTILEPVLNFLLVPIIVPIHLWFYSRRRMFPIAGREPLLMNIVGYVIALNAVIYAMGEFQRIPCQFTAWLYCITINTSIIVYSQRAWILLFRFEITENLGLLNEMKRSGCSSEELQRAEGWFLRNRHRIKPLHLFLWVLLDYGVQIIAFSIATVADPTMQHRSCSAKDPNVLTLFYNNFLLVGRGLFIVFLAIKLRAKGADNFKFKLELKIVIFIVLGNFILASGLRYVYPSVNWQFWVGWVMILFSLYPSCLMSLRISYIEERKRLAALKRELSNLRSLLRMEEGFKSFYKFLSTEFSTENVLCWRDVDDWLTMVRASRSLCDSPVISERKIESPNPDSRPHVSKIELFRRAQEIYDNYIDPRGAPYLVNLAFSLRNRLREAMEYAGQQLSSFATPQQTLIGCERGGAEDIEGEILNTPTGLREFSTSVQKDSITSESNALSPSTSFSSASTFSSNTLTLTSQAMSIPVDSLSAPSSPLPQPRRSTQIRQAEAEASWQGLIEAFTELEKAIFDLMNNDSYIRYKDSPFFVKLETEAKTASKYDTHQKSKGSQYDSKGGGTGVSKDTGSKGTGSKGSRLDELRIPESPERDRLLPGTGTPDIELVLPSSSTHSPSSQPLRSPNGL